LMPLLLRGLVLVWVYNLGNTHDSVVEIDVPGIGPWISGGVEAALMLANLVGFVLVTVFVDLFGGFVCGALSLVSWIPGFPEPGGCKVER
ncbi:MAG: hypothetical protein VYE77_00920, partial [Planctomycetota bacterium]|nr:hypothetical protein [Planctomycetota bacterium]